MILPYVYKLTHKESGLYYIGYRCKNVSLGIHSTDDLGISYFTSSKIINSKNILEYDIEIIAEFYIANDAYDFEQGLIREHWEDNLLINDHYHFEGAGRWRNSGHSKETREKIRLSKIGSKRSEESKKKQSESSKGKILSEEHKKKLSESRIGDKNPNFGKTPTEETKTKMRENHKGMEGKIHSDESREKMSKSQSEVIHRPHSEETKLKMSVAQKGHVVSEETKQKISNSKKGHLESEETRKKKSLAHTGKKRPYSEETLAKIRARWTAKKLSFKGVATNRVE